MPTISHQQCTARLLPHPSTEATSTRQPYGLAWLTTENDSMDKGYGSLVLP